METIVSAVMGDGDNKKIYVLFSDKDRSAEATIPDCKIISNKGFDDDEIGQMEAYLQMNKELIINEASRINPIKSFLGK